MEEEQYRRSTLKPTVEPIKDPEDISKIRRMLRSNPRDLLIFDMAVQTGIKMKHLLRLKVKDLQGVKVGENLLISGGMGNASPRLMSRTIYKTFQRHLEENGLTEDDYLFKSRKGGHPLTVPTVSNMVKKWFEAANIGGLAGFKSLRKTWGSALQKSLSRGVRENPETR